MRTADSGDRKVSQRVLALAEAMHNATSIVTMATFLSACKTFNRTAALAKTTMILWAPPSLMTPPSPLGRHGPPPASTTQSLRAGNGAATR